MDSKTRARVKKQILDGSIYKKKRYISWRKKVFSRDRYKCQLCEKVGGNIQAHHIKPKYKFTSKIFEVTNGITLCWGCHNKIHKEDLVDKYVRKFKKLARENKAKPKVKRVRRRRCLE